MKVSFHLSLCNYINLVWAAIGKGDEKLFLPLILEGFSAKKPKIIVFLRDILLFLTLK